MVQIVTLDNKLIYNTQIKTTALHHLEFIDTLIGVMAHFVTIAKDMYVLPHKVIKKTKKIKSLPQYNILYPHNFNSQTSLSRFLHKKEINSNDLFIWTDGSYEHDDRYVIPRLCRNRNLHNT